MANRKIVPVKTGQVLSHDKFIKLKNDGYLYEKRNNDNPDQPTAHILATKNVRIELIEID